MEAGESGVTGVSVTISAEKETKQEAGSVTHQHHSMEGRIVRERTRRDKNVTRNLIAVNLVDTDD